MKLTEIFTKMMKRLQITSFRAISAFLLIGTLAIIFSSCSISPPSASQATATLNIFSTPAQATTILTKTPISVSQRHGGWLDEIVFSVINKDSAVTQLQVGAIDIYANGLAASDFLTIKEAELKYA